MFPPPVPAWHQDLTAGNLDGLLERLRAGMDPNVSQWVGSAMVTPLSTVVSALPSSVHWQSFAQALLDHGAHIVPRIEQAVPTWSEHPLAAAMSAAAPPGAADFLLDRLTDKDVAALDQPILDIVATTGQAQETHLGLVDAALRRGLGPLAMRLLDMGLAPRSFAMVPAAHGQPPRLQHSTLTMALSVAHAPSMAPVLTRLLAMDWPQRDLDETLRWALPNRAPRWVVARLLQKGASPAPFEPLAESALLRAIGSPGLSPESGVVADLVAHGANAHELLDFQIPSAANGEGIRPRPHAHPVFSCVLAPAVRATQPLGLAAFCGHAAAVEDFLVLGADPNHVAASGHAPLHLACLHAVGNDDHAAQVIELLLAAGADPGALDAGNRTPLESWMASHHRKECAAPATLGIARRLLAATLGRLPDKAGDVAGLLADRTAKNRTSPLLATWRQALERLCLARDLDGHLPIPSPRPLHRM